MFSTVLNAITSYLDRRFVITFLFPSLLFWSGLLGVVALNNNPTALWATWDQQTGTNQIIQIVAALAWVTFFAYFVANQLTWLTQQFEGYWDWLPFHLGERLRQWRQGYHSKVLTALNVQNDNSADELIYYRYPLPDEIEHVLPTQLGNILKNAELYSYQRYQVDAVLMWPRLYAILPKEYANLLGDAKASLDSMLVISTLSGVFAVITGGYLLISGSVWWLFLICFLGGLILGRLAYQSAVRAAIPYAQLIKSAFDLYRGDLLEKMGYERPKSLDDEIKFWDNLCKLIYRNIPEDASLLRYKGATDKQSITVQEFPWPISLLKKLLNRLTGKNGSL
jgi:hypothetical protein